MGRDACQSAEPDQSLAVDTVAGATNTSKAILAAVEDCVKQAGGDVEALTGPIQGGSEKKEESRTADIVIVGSGIAGLSAALSAAETGADVVVLEKMATTGGTTTLSGGYLICVESEFFADAEIDDSLETFMDYWAERMAYSGQESGYPDTDRTVAVFAQTGAAVDWLKEKGISWEEDPVPYLGPYPVVHNPGDGRNLIDEMVAAATGCVGDGLQMAQAAGAAIYDSFFTSINGCAISPEFLFIVGDPYMILPDAQLGVNAKGERFSSETAQYPDALGSDMIQDGNAPFWYIYDSSDADITAMLEKGVEAGVVAKAETIEDLAKEIKVDPTVLQNTYGRYMELVKAGTDTDFNKPAENLKALETAPFYGVKFCPTTFGSQGGVLTDTEGRALTENGQPIAGLYVTGADSNRYFYNENYVLAASLGLYATTGRITGAAAGADIQ